MFSIRQRKALDALLELGLTPGRDRSANDLAAALSMSRDSIHQLLLPLVRAGWVAAGRGRNGGYRLTGAADAATVLAVAGSYGEAKALASIDDALDPVGGVEARADRAYREVLAGVTVGQLLERVRADREALNWTI